MLASCCLLRQAARNIKSGATYPSICGGEHIDGYNQLYEAQRKPAPILEAACWSHGRRKFVDLVKQGEAPIVSEAVRRIDMLFEIERSINGQTPAAHCRPWNLDAPAASVTLHQERYRQSDKLPLQPLGSVHPLLRRRPRLSYEQRRRASVAGGAVGRRNWTFAGSDAGGHRAAAVYTLIETCKMNDVDPQAWLADVLATLPDHPANKVADLLSWNWKANQQSKAAVAAWALRGRPSRLPAVLAGCVPKPRHGGPWNGPFVRRGSDFVGTFERKTPNHKNNLFEQKQFQGESQHRETAFCLPSSLSRMRSAGNWTRSIDRQPVFYSIITRS
jgi:hypothetical protein